MTRLREQWLVAAAAGWVLLSTPPAPAGVTTKVAAEAAEAVLKKFGAKAVGEGAEALTRRIEKLALKYGDDAVAAVRHAGPRAFRAADEAGPHAGAALRAIARHGDDGVAFVAAHPKALAVVAKHGDDAAAALVKHHGLIHGVIETGGEPAVRALAAVGPQAGRRLVMLHEGGELAAIGRTPEVLAVIARYGDAAADFVWRHKGALAAAAVVGTFLADPEPYLSGAKELTAEVVREVAAPLAAMPGGVATEVAGGIARGTDWTPVVLAVTVPSVGVGAWLVVRAVRRARP